VLCNEQQKQTKGATKPSHQNNKKQLKATEKWLLTVGARLPTPIVGGVPGYRLGYP